MTGRLVQSTELLVMGRSFPFFFGITGSVGRSFWTKAGFEVVNMRPMAKELCPDENARALIDSQAQAAGISNEQAWSFIDMACVL